MAKKVPLTPEQKAEKQKNKMINKLFGGKNIAGAGALAEKMFGAGSLGRVSSGFDADGNRIFENQDILNRYKGGLEGYTGAETNAMREDAAREMDRNEATQLATFAREQARNKVRGPAAMAQNAILARQRQEAGGQFESNLLIANADEKQRRLGAYNEALQGVRGDERSRQEFNLGQVGAEKAGQFGTLFGGLQYGQQKKAGKQAFKLQKQYMNILKDYYKNAGRGLQFVQPNTQGLVQEGKDTLT